MAAVKGGNLLGAFEWRRRLLTTPAAREQSQRRGKRVCRVAAEQGPPRYKIAGMGAATLDYLAVVKEFPQPDQKIRTEEFQVQGGGNCANTMTGLAKLGIHPYLLSKIGDDAVGIETLKELHADGVNTDSVVIASGVASSFTYVIVDQAGDTRTCIHTPTDNLEPSELSSEDIDGFLKDAEMIYFDGRLTIAAIVVAERAREMQIPVVVEAERSRADLESLIELADIIVTSTHFPSAFTGEEGLGDALTAMLQRFENARMIVTTLGAKGSVVLERCQHESNVTEKALETALDENWRKLVQLEASDGEPYVVSKNQTPIRCGETVVSETFSPASKLSVEERATVPAALNADQEGSIAQSGASKSYPQSEANTQLSPIRLTTATAARISPDAVVDTTGAGDAFIAGLLYGLAHKFPLQSTLQFASMVAACKCTELGSRSGQPTLSNIWHFYKTSSF